jgi:hypothetical protein
MIFITILQVPEPILLKLLIAKRLKKSPEADPGSKPLFLLQPLNPILAACHGRASFCRLRPAPLLHDRMPKIRHQ